MNPLKTCPQCGDQFEPKIQRQKFCSNRCRFNNRIDSRVVDERCGVCEHPRSAHTRGVGHCVGWGGRPCYCSHYRLKRRVKELPPYPLTKAESDSVRDAVRRVQDDL